MARVFIYVLGSVDRLDLKWTEANGDICSIAIILHRKMRDDMFGSGTNYVSNRDAQLPNAVWPKSPPLEGLDRSLIEFGVASALNDRDTFYFPIWSDMDHEETASG